MNPKESVESTVSRAKAMLDQTKKEGGKAFAGSSFEKALSSKDMSQQTQMRVTPPPPTTPITNAMSDVSGMNVSSDPLLNRLTQEKTDAESKRQSAYTDYLAELTSMKGETALTQEKYGEKGGVDETLFKLNQYDSMLEKEQVRLDRELETLDKNQQGLFGGALQDAKFDAEVKSLRKQADISIVRAGYQRDYDTAKAIADRAVSAYLESQKQRQEILKLNYEENKEMFTKAEQREFDVMLADRERKFTQEADTQKTLQDLAIEAQRNGAPASVASKMLESGSVSGAMEVGGNYIGLIERRKANAAMANADLDRRLALLKLAEAGDPEAMKELGLDPTAPDVEQTIKSQQELTHLDEEIARVDQMLANKEGLATSSGTIRSPFLSSFGVNVPGATLAGAGVGSTIPVVGTLAGGAAGLATGVVTGAMEYAQLRDQKADFLAKANYVITNLTTEKLIDLKARGVSFTPLSNEELRQVGRSAGEISGYAITDESGKVVGFTSESGVRDALAQVQSILNKAKEREYQKMLNSAENAEIDSL